LGRKFTYEAKAKHIKSCLSVFKRHWKDLESYEQVNPKSFTSYKAFRPTGLAYKCLAEAHYNCVMAFQAQLPHVKPEELDEHVARYQGIVDEQVTVLDHFHDYVTPL